MHNRAPVLLPLEPLLASAHLLEVSHVAHRLSTSEEYVRRLIRQKKLKAIRLGARWRIDPVDLQAFIDRQRTATEDALRGRESIARSQSYAVNH